MKEIYIFSRIFWESFTSSAEGHGNTFNSTAFKCRTTLGIQSGNCPDLAPLAQLFLGPCCIVPCIVDIRPGTGRGRGWIWPASLSPEAKWSRYLTASRSQTAAHLWCLWTLCSELQFCRGLAASEKGRMGRCLSACAWHGAVGTHLNPAQQSKAGTYPWYCKNTSASGESKVNQPNQSSFP